MSEIKIVITGDVGSGKTTAIASISEIAVISTDVAASDEVSAMKASTTVAMDYGELTLEDGSKLRIYGTPGQERFSFMWDILAKGALGFIVMVNDLGEKPLESLAFYLDRFSSYIETSTMAIGVTHVDVEGMRTMDKYYDFLEAKQIYYPIFPVDAREPDDVKLLIEAMASMITC